MQDIGVGANNTVWVTTGTGDGPVYYRTAGNTAWTAAPGSGTRIDSDINGTAYLVNSAGQLFTSSGSTFTAMPAGNVRDVGVSAGAPQVLWVLAGTVSAPSLYGYNGTSFVPATPAVTGKSLDVAPDGTVWVVGAGGVGMYHYSLNIVTATLLQVYPGNWSDVSVAADGTVWGISDSGVLARLTGGSFVIDPNSGSFGSSISAGSDGDTPYVTYAGRLFQRNENDSFIDDHTVNIANGNTVTYNVIPGTYTITEDAAPAPWQLTDIVTASGSVVSKDVTSRTITITVTADQTAYVEFDNANIISNVVSNTCGSPYIEDFGATGTTTPQIGPPLPNGYTAYHANGSAAGATMISNDAASAGWPFTGPDHTPNDIGGYSLLINGGFGQDEFFRRRFTGLIPGVTYFLSMYATSLSDAPVKPNIVMEARQTNGTLLTSFTSGDIAYSGVSWNKYQLEVTADASGTINFIVRNNQQTVGINGNDIAIDDISIGVSCDYGDAPDSYATTTSANGPSHKETALLKLGGIVDGETDGLPTADAKGDDGVSSSDEDGISTFPTITGGAATAITNYTVNVNITNGIGATANLCGWIDWNSNGTFESSEGVCTTVANGVATAPLTWPAATLTGIAGTTGVYARFRITTDVLTSGNPAGSASNGEVEDYFITFQTPMPVTLVSFTAERSESGALLNWITTQETNSDQFEIQRSADGKNWFGIGRVDAKGESKVNQTYSYRDQSASLPNGEQLYRLKMIDRDGTFAYSRIRSVKFDTGFETSIFPNPVDDKLNLKVSDWKQVKKVSIVNTSGLEVYNSGILLSDTVSMKNLASGVYIVSITRTDGSVQIHKVVHIK